MFLWMFLVQEAFNAMTLVGGLRQREDYSTL